MKYSAPALSRGMAVLELLSSTKTSLTLSQVANKLELTNSAIFRVMYILENLGYIEKQSGNLYQASAKLFSLGVQSINNYSILDNVYPILKKITTHIEQSCHFSTKVQNSMVVLAKIDSPSLGLSIRTGYNKPLESSSSGKTILAFLPQNIFDEVIEAIKKNHKKSFMKELMEDLAQIKSQGYNQEKSQFVNGIIDLSVPIFTKIDGGIPSCISVPYLDKVDHNLYDKKGVIDILKQSAKEIEESLL